MGDGGWEWEVVDERVVIFSWGNGVVGERFLAVVVPSFALVLDHLQRYG